MILNVEGSLGEGISTSIVLGSAYPVDLHLFVIPVLGTTVGIVQTIRRHVWHDVGIMDDSVNWYLRVKVGCKCNIANSWFTVRIELAHLSKGCLEIQSRNASDSASETMPSYVNECCTSVFVKNELHLVLDSSRNFSIAVVESLMDLTSTTLGVADLLEVIISQPTLDVGGASQSNNDCVVGFAKTYKALDVLRNVKEGFDLHKSGVTSVTWYFLHSGQVQEEI